MKFPNFLYLIAAPFCLADVLDEFEETKMGPLWKTTSGIVSATFMSLHGTVTPRSEPFFLLLGNLMETVDLVPSSSGNQIEFFVNCGYDQFGSIKVDYSADQGKTWNTVKNVVETEAFMNWVYVTIPVDSLIQNESKVRFRFNSNGSFSKQIDDLKLVGFKLAEGQTTAPSTTKNNAGESPNTADNDSSQKSIASTIAIWAGAATAVVLFGVAVRKFLILRKIHNQPHNHSQPTIVAI